MYSRLAVGPLEASECSGYLEARIMASGGRTTDLFNPMVSVMIHELAEGWPGLVGILADRAMLLAYGRGCTEIDDLCVMGAAEQIVDEAHFDVPLAADAVAEFAEFADEAPRVAAQAGEAWLAAPSAPARSYPPVPVPLQVVPHPSAVATFVNETGEHASKLTAAPAGGTERQVASPATDFTKGLRELTEVARSDSAMLATALEAGPVSLTHEDSNPASPALPPLPKRRTASVPRPAAPPQGETGSSPTLSNLPPLPPRPQRNAESDAPVGARSAPEARNNASNRGHESVALDNHDPEATVVEYEAGNRVPAADMPTPGSSPRPSGVVENTASVETFGPKKVDTLDPRVGEPRPQSRILITPRQKSSWWGGKKRPRLAKSAKAPRFVKSAKSAKSAKPAKPGKSFKFIKSGKSAEIVGSPESEIYADTVRVSGVPASQRLNPAATLDAYPVPPAPTARSASSLAVPRLPRGGASTHAATAAQLAPELPPWPGVEQHAEPAIEVPARVRRPSRAISAPAVQSARGRGRDISDDPFREQQPVDPFAPELIPVVTDPHGLATEWFRILRLRIEDWVASTPGRSKVLLVTSAEASAGKTFVATNLALLFGSEPSSRLLTVDGDLRWPRFEGVFGIPRQPGFADVLAGRAQLEESVHYISEVNLHVVPAGRPGNPRALMTSERLEATMAQMREMADLVIVDSPPLEPMVDVRSMAAVADGVFVVVRGG